MMGMFGGGGPPEPKGDISQLWKLLGVEMMAATKSSGRISIPSRSWASSAAGMVFIDEGLAEGGHGTLHPFDPDDQISRGHAAGAVPVAGSFRPASRTRSSISPTGRHGPKQRHDRLPGNGHGDAPGGMMGVRRNLRRKSRTSSRRM